MTWSAILREDMDHTILNVRSMDSNYPTKKLREKIFNEDAVCYAFYKNYIAQDSEVFFKLSHNMSYKAPRGWDYWCAPEVDIIEIKKDKMIIAYELKGARKYKENSTDKNWPGFYDGLGQALAYLDLPKIVENGKFRAAGVAFDYVYLVHARPNEGFEEFDLKILNLTPIGFITALPNGKFIKICDAKSNPLRDEKTKQHFLNNLHTLEKHSTNSKIFRKICQKGETYFSVI